jgi:hypothetical protein
LDQRLEQQTGLAFDLRPVVNSLVPICWLASDLRSVVNSLVLVC